jgi:membrane protein
VRPDHGSMWSYHASDRTSISSYGEKHMSSLVRAIKKLFDDDMAVYAAALSYHLLFSIFPFMIFLLALLSLLNITELFDWMLK